MLVRLRPRALACVDRRAGRGRCPLRRRPSFGRSARAPERPRARAGGRPAGRAARSPGRSKSRAPVLPAIDPCPCRSARGRATSCRGRCVPRCRRSAAPANRLGDLLGLTVRERPAIQAVFCRRARLRSRVDRRHGASRRAPLRPRRRNLEARSTAASHRRRLRWSPRPRRRRAPPDARRAFALPPVARATCAGRESRRARRSPV